MSPREEILAAVREAASRRRTAPHPGPLEASASDPVARIPTLPPEDREREIPGLFARMLEEVGGEVVRVAHTDQAREWLRGFLGDFAGASVSPMLPAGLLPQGYVAEVPPEEAPLGISFAVGAAAASGTLLLDSREGRLLQLLPPAHLVVLPTASIAPTLGEALATCRGELPSALGLHSGPSSSADIGMVTVQGVHGPGRLVVLLIDGPDERR